LIAIVVAAVVLIAAIAVYVLLTPRAPSVDLGPVVPLSFGSGYIVNVTSADPAEPLSDYAAVLATGATVHGRLSPLVNGSANGSLIFFDVDENDRLGAGDAFGIGPLPDGDHTLTVSWRGTTVATKTFSTETRPIVIFSSVTVSIDSFEFDVAGVSASFPASSYRINMEVNGTASNIVTLSASMTLTVGANTYSVTYSDLGGEGNLTGGDHFRVTQSGGVVPNTEYFFRLLWTTGAMVGSVTYNS
jgi:hypothetical protein